MTIPTSEDERRNPAKEFLSCIAPGEDRFTFQTFDDVVLTNSDGKKRKRKRGSLVKVLHGTLDEHWASLVELNTEGAGIYVTINQTDLSGREARNVVAVRAVFLDLDGAPLEPVLGRTEPTVIVESSEGKFQVHYRAEGVGLGAFEGIQKALAGEFGGDAKVCDLPRVMRLPGLFHMKDLDAPWLVKITKSSPEKQMSLEQIQALLQAEAEEPDASDLNTLALSKMDLWVPLIFGEKARRTAAGGYRVKPEDLGREGFEEELSLHPDGIKDFAVADQGDPREGRRTPIDIVVEFGGKNYQEAVNWLSGILGFTGVKASDFFHLTPINSYIWRITGDVWTGAGVKTRFGLKGRNWINKNQFVDTRAWVPGDPEIIQDKVMSDGGWTQALGARCYNTYRGPDISLGDASRAGPWISHAKKILLPDDVEAFFDYCAHTVQKPGVKINHAKVLIGASGIGKDTLLEPIRAAVGPQNWQEIDPPDLFSSFNKFRKCRVLKINELGNIGDRNRYQLYEKLKVVCAAPPSSARINEKNIGEYYVANVHATFMTMNPSEGSIYLPPDDRRMSVLDIQGTNRDFTEQYFLDLWTSYWAGGTADVAAWLMARDISMFEPGAAPRKTLLWRKIVEENQPWIIETIRGIVEGLSLGDPPLAPPCLTLEIVASQADPLAQAWMSEPRNSWAVLRALSMSGYERVKNPSLQSGRWPVGGRSLSIYAHQRIPGTDRLRVIQEFIDQQERRPGAPGLFPLRVVVPPTDPE